MPIEELNTYINLTTVPFRVFDLITSPAPQAQVSGPAVCVTFELTRTSRGDEPCCCCVEGWEQRAR